MNGHRSQGTSLQVDRLLYRFTWTWYSIWPTACSDSVFRVDVAIVAGSSVHYHVSGDGSEYSISKFSIESEDSLGESGLGCASRWPLVDIIGYPGVAVVIGCSLPLFRVGGEHWISRFSFESEDSLENRGAREFRGTARFAISWDR